MLVREFAHVQYHLYYHRDGSVRKDRAHITFNVTDSCGSMLAAMRLSGTPALGEFAKGVFYLGLKDLDFHFFMKFYAERPTMGGPDWCVPCRACLLPTSKR